MFVETIQVRVDRRWIVAVDAEDVANSLPIRGGNHHTPAWTNHPPHFFEYRLRLRKMFDDFRCDRAIERRIGKREPLATGDDSNMALIGRYRKGALGIGMTEIHRTNRDTSRDERLRQPAVAAPNVEHKRDPVRKGADDHRTRRSSGLR